MTRGTKNDTTRNRKVWKTPEIRSTIPSQRTRGGPFDVNDQDDAFYSSS
jgi:hypothetical protein